MGDKLTKIYIVKINELKHLSLTRLLFILCNIPLGSKAL